MELDTEFLAGVIAVGTERKLWFLHPLYHQKVQFHKPGKYSIINKSTTFAHICNSYVNLLNFVSFLHKSQQLIFFSKKKKKITCLLTVNICTYYLELIVRLQNYLQRKRNFNIRMYFILNLSCFILSLDSSACLGNNILPDICS